MSRAITASINLADEFFLENELEIDLMLATSAWCTPSFDEDIRKAVDLLKPVGCGFEMIRVGGDGDGAYILPNCLEKIDACFSPGVSDLIDFETELADKWSIPSYLCDASTSLDKLNINNQLHEFRQLWIGSFTGGNTISLDAWVLDTDHGDSDHLMLQMDIEGSEYNALLACSHSILSRFQLAVIEFHFLEALASSRFLNTRILPTLQKLDSIFDCVHAHANNCCGTVELAGYSIPRVIEITYLRRSDNKLPHTPWRPHPLDIVNVPSLAPLHLGSPWTKG